MDGIAKVFSVVLHDFPGLDTDQTHAAESRFMVEASRALGGPDQVLPSYDAFLAANESALADLSREEVHRAAEWARAYERARVAGFWGLGDPADAYFQIVPF